MNWAWGKPESCGSQRRGGGQFCPSGRAMTMSGGLFIISSGERQVLRNRHISSHSVVTDQRAKGLG